jgi:hypothetical protein
VRKLGRDKIKEDSNNLIKMFLQKQVVHLEIFNIAEEVLNTLLALDYAQPDPATFLG